MELSKEEKDRLQLFSNLAFNRDQINAVLGRKISNSEWRQYQNKPPKKHKKSKSSKLNKYFKTFWKSIDKPDINALKNTEHTQTARGDRYKKLCKTVAQDAADTGFKRRFKTKIEDQKDKFHFVKSLFEDSEQELSITKLSEYYSSKYQT